MAVASIGYLSRPPLAAAVMATVTPTTTTTTTLTTTTTSNKNSSYKNYVASISAGFTAIICFNQLDCLRVRWQVLPNIKPSSEIPGSIVEYGRNVIREEGLFNGLWRPGFWANMSAVGMSTGIRLGAYPYLREVLTNTFANGATTAPAYIMFSSGLVSGAVGYFVSTPLWSAKTRVQAEVASRGVREISSAPRLLLDDFNAGGIARLWRGALPLVARGAFTTSGQMLGYDYSKSRLREAGWMKDGLPLHVVCSFISGLTASTIACPSDALMTRYMTATSSVSLSHPEGNARATTLSGVVREIWRERAFFRGWVPLSVRFIPTFCIAMPVYESIRKLLGLGFL